MRKKVIIREQPLEYLRRSSDGTPFPAEVVKNWYMARAYVLDRLKDVVIGPDSGEHLKLVVGGDSPLMLAVVRQLCLSAHFVNYEEYDFRDRLSCRNRTEITLVSGMDAASILRELEKEEYLGQLPALCKMTVYGQVRNADSFLDVEIRVVHEQPEPDPDTILITEADVERFVQDAPADEVFSIDTRRAVLAARVYDLGGLIDNIPAEDIHSARRYLIALDTYRYKLAEDKIGPLVDPATWEKDPKAVVNGVSSLFCADCFPSRARAIRQYAVRHGIPEQEAWERNNGALSCSEHNRWMVERLILGCRPVTDAERLTYESLFGGSRKAYWKCLKNRREAPAHVDLCSFRDLRRIDPDNLKYDSFLLLAIPIILEKA